MAHRPRHLVPSPRRRVRRAVPLLGGLAAVGVVAGLGAALLRPADRPTSVATEVGSTRVETTEPPTTTTTTAPPTTLPPRRATLLVGGDVLIHAPVWQAAAVGDGHDFSPMLDPIAPLVAGADLALCHLEVTLARPGEAFTGYPRFRAPAALATDLAEAGFDGCSTSSNHALDYGAAGVAATLDGLDAAGLGHAGTARSPEEDQRAARYDAAGFDVAHLSYSYGFNGFTEPADQGWLVDQIDPATVVTDALAARRAGAEVVVVSMHWGDEYAHDVTAAQQQAAEAIAAYPGAVDLVVGHHAHVVQPISRVGDLWVVWGMGNLLSNNSPGCCRTAATDGVLVTATLVDRPDRQGVAIESLAVTPTWNERTGFRVLPAAEVLLDPTLAGPLDPALVADLRASYDRTLGHLRALRPDDPALRPTATLPPA